MTDQTSADETEITVTGADGEMLDQLTAVIAEAEQAMGVEFSKATLTADMTNTVVGWIKAQAKPWSMMSRDEQYALISGASAMVNGAVAEMVRVIAADGRNTITAKVEQVVRKNGIKAILAMSAESEHRHLLFDAQDTTVLIVLADSSEYVGGALQEPDAPKNGQHELPLGDDDDKPVFDNTPSGGQ